MKFREFSLNAGLAVGSLVVFALAIELTLHFVVPLVYRPRITRIDPSLGWYHNSSVGHVGEKEGHRFHFSYNSHGFRSPEHAYEKPDDQLRVLFLGDSFTDGAEVGDQELFTWHLQERLKGIEVINLGVYGHSTAQELLVFQHFGVRYDPDLVVLMTTSNDFVGNVMALESFGPAPRFMLDGDSLRFEGTDHPLARAAFFATNLPVPAAVHRHSLIYYLVNKLIFQPLRADRIVEVRRARADELDRSRWPELYKRLVVRIGQDASDVGADFVVGFAYLRNELLKHPISPNLELIESLRAQNIEALDLFEQLKMQESAADSLYYKVDIHWNSAGHAFVADVFEPFIRTWQTSR